MLEWEVLYQQYAILREYYSIADPKNYMVL